MKKGDDVADDIDYYAVRTTVSQDWVAATEELFLRTGYIKLSLHIRQVKMWGGKDMNGQHDTFGSPSLVSHLPPWPSNKKQSFQ